MATSAVPQEDGDLSVTALDREVVRHFDGLTEAFYLATWHPEHIHFGLFEPEDLPERGPPFTGADPKLTRGLERMLETVIGPAGVRERHRVADAGCGVGGTAMYLARTRGCTVTGVNLSRKQLQIGAQKVAQAGLGARVDFKYGNCARRLPFDNDSVDIVVNIESACHYSDRQQFLHEVCRILKPGGRIAAVDWLARRGITAADYDKYIQPVCEHWDLDSLETLAGYTTRLLPDAGLTVLEHAGFEGKELGTLRLLERNYRMLRGLKFMGLLPAHLEPALRLIETLVRAWQPGHFELGRYLAVKPGGDQE
ncbi:MAG: methyltransferase domain-containing protein [Gammaproteobacteria bacterium]|nr:methyltransferase domain-containing protein [Gammaproteobacteria bacterium]